MKFLASVAAIVGFVGAVSAQTECLSAALAIPACGQNILLSYAQSFGCGLTDFACQCSHSAALQSTAQTPIINACNPTTALIVQTSANALCSCVKYSGNVPASVAVTATTSGINNYGNQLCVGYGLAIPACGTSVLQSLANSIGQCDDTDFQCQCKFQSSVQAIASTPVINACGTTTALLVQSAAAQLCSCISANNAPLQTKASNASGTASSSHAAAVSNIPYVPLTGIGGLLSIFAGFVAWL